MVLRNYEGYITTYEEPDTYQQARQGRPARTASTSGPEPGQSGILGLLEGERMWIEPKGFEETHTRGNTEAHRLQDPSKWVPVRGRGDRRHGGRSAARPRGGRPSGHRREAGLRPGRGAAPARGRTDRLGPRRAALARPAG